MSAKATTAPCMQGERTSNFCRLGFFQRTDIAYPTRQRTHMLHMQLCILVAQMLRLMCQKAHLEYPWQGMASSMRFATSLHVLRVTRKPPKDDCSNKKNTASSSFDLVSAFFLCIPTTSHGLETSLRSLSETQTRFTEKMCQVQEEGWSWL